MNNIQILVVEDELLIAKNLSRKLKKMGYAIIDIVASGEEAIKQAAATKPDLILMDLSLKGDIDGIEAAAIIQAGNNIPIVYLTAYADEDNIDRAAMVGCYGYLLKPFREKELHTTIQMAMSKHKEQCRIQRSLIDNFHKYQAVSSLLNAFLSDWKK